MATDNNLNIFVVFEPICLLFKVEQFSDRRLDDAHATPTVFAHDPANAALCNHKSSYVPGRAARSRARPFNPSCSSSLRESVSSNPASRAAPSALRGKARGAYGLSRSGNC
jgi:hypothetical protein